MGCDIHAYLEIENPNDRVESIGRVRLGRDYVLFGLMAGVRGDTVLFEPRGLPKNIGWDVERDNWLYVIDEDEVGEEGCCSREQAESWLSCGSTYKDERKMQISDPDAHSHSFLYTNEMILVVDRLEALSKKEGYRPYVAVYAVVAAMKEIDKRGNKARLTFWFDN